MISFLAYFCVLSLWLSAADKAEQKTIGGKQNEIHSECCTWFPAEIGLSEVASYQLLNPVHDLTRVPDYSRNSLV